MYDGPTYFAWFVLTLLFFLGVAFVVWIGSLPKKIADNRNHPQVDAINALSWFGLLFGGVGWVIAFVWALYRPAHSDGNREMSSSQRPDSQRIDQLLKDNDALKSRLTQLEDRLSKIQDSEK